MWIDFEGIDGSGKTTLSFRVARRLRDMGLRVTHPREGGGFRSRIAARIREITREGELAALCPETELLLNAAREAQILTEEIRPAILRGDVVLTDRGLYSHLAVARFVRGLPGGASASVAEFAANGCWPDLVIYVDVDPDVARLRRRLRKIREGRGGPPGRKGLQGESFARRSRAAFLSLAASDPRRWHVVGNTWRTPDEAADETMAILAPILKFDAPARRPAPEPPALLAAGTPEDLAEGFFSFAASLRDPGMAALLVAGIDDPQAHVVRCRAVDAAPDAAVYSVAGIDSAAAWDIRRQVRPSLPAHAVRSLTGLDTPLAWEWRFELEAETPTAVLQSVAGSADPLAHRLRHRLWDAAPEEGLRGLAGLADSASWAFRCRALRRGKTGALAESIARLEAEPAWRIRDELRGEFPISVLRSLQNLDDDRAWSARREMAAAAPRAVLETMTGLNGSASEEIRDSLQQRCPEEVAESLTRLATPRAWERRAALLEPAPASVVRSLRGLEPDARATALVKEAVACDPRPRVVREAVRFHLRRRP